MADVSHNEHLKAIKLSTYGIMFCGTPHQGTDSASWGKVLVNVASIFRHTSTSLLKHLEKDSEWLQTQIHQYRSISSDFFTIFCFESYPTPLLTGESIMVSVLDKSLGMLSANPSTDSSSTLCGCTWYARRGIR